jgi:hypothetical protein
MACGGLRLAPDACSLGGPSPAPILALSSCGRRRPTPDACSASPARARGGHTRLLTVMRLCDLAEIYHAHARKRPRLADLLLSERKSDRLTPSQESKFARFFDAAPKIDCCPRRRARKNSHALLPPRRLRPAPLGRGNKRAGRFVLIRIGSGLRPSRFLRQGPSEPVLLALTDAACAVTR